MTVPPQLGKAPFVAILAGICGGIVMFYRAGVPLWAGFVAVAVGLGAWVLNELNEPHRHSWRMLAAILPGFVGVGIMAASLYAPVNAERIPGDCRVRGIVRESVPAVQGTRLTVELRGMTDRQGVALPLLSRCHLYVDSAGYKPGDLVCFPAFFDEPEGDAGYREYLFSRGIDLMARLPDSLVVSAGHERVWNSVPMAWQRAAADRLDSSSLSREGGDFLKALLLGDRSGVDRATRKDFADAGIAHLLAVSGLHVGILVGLLLLILWPLNFFRMAWLRYLMAVAGVWIYACVAGMNPPVVRAAVMATCLMAGLLMERRGGGINALCLAGCLILLVAPRSLFDAGFLLSFVVTAAILLFAGSFTVQNSRRRRHAAYKLADWAIVACFAFLASWLITARFFHSVALVFLPLNLLLVPLLPVYFGIGLGYLLLLFLGCDAAWMAFLPDGGYVALRGAVAAIGSLPGVVGELWVAEPVVWLYMAGLLAFGFALAYRRRVWLAGACVCVLLATTGAALLPAGPPPDRVTVGGTHSYALVSATVNGVTERLRLSADTLAVVTVNGKTMVYAGCREVAESGVTEAPCRVDALIIGPHYAGDLRPLLSRFRPDTICCHPYMPLDSRDRLTAQWAR